MSLQKLNAVCGACGSEASLTITTTGGAKGAEKKIGGKEMYDASCIFCTDRNHTNSNTAAAAGCASAANPNPTPVIALSASDAKSAARS